MITWTDSAKETLENYCRRTRERLQGSGADPEEVVEDLRRHVEEEVRAAKLTVATEEEVRRILGRVGEPAGEGWPEAAPRKEAATGQPRAKGLGKLAFACALIFGVFLPAGTLVFELTTGASADILFDPIPTWFQVVAVALVPAVNFWLAVAALRGRSRFPNIAGGLSGVAAGVCCFYSILYLPFSPFAALGVIYLGLGLIPLSPYIAWICTMLLRRAVASRLGSSLHFFWPGFGVGLAMLVMVQIPTALTYYGMSAAVSEDPAFRGHGLKTLRLLGDQELLLRRCYDDTRDESGFDLVRGIASGGKDVKVSEAREIYYRVTGTPFNAVPPPALYTRSGRWDDAEEGYTWDDGQGGDAVAGRVKGLSLAASRMDAVAEPEAAVAYCEWTLEFKNLSALPREARGQIALPPGGVVSRLTLWVNGEEQEAAFGGRAEVHGAYQQVAFTQHRDPVLVTTCGPDRVLMQCFPVPANGGTMKLRLGITAPLALESEERGRFQWPRFVERNFGMAPDFNHAIWIDSSQKLAMPGITLMTNDSGPQFTMHGSVADTSLNDLEIERMPEAGNTWTPALDTNQIIRQRIEKAAAQHISRIVFVIDGSARMKEWRTEIAEAIGKVPIGTEIAVIVAGDNVVKLNAAPAQADAELLKELNREILNTDFAGGRDNLPALTEGWDLAAACDAGAVIWIHATQPVLLSSADLLRQRLERTTRIVPIYDLWVRPGPNRISEALDGLRALRPAPGFAGSVRGDLENLIGILSGEIPQYNIVRERVAADFTGDRGRKVSRHIERLWARDEADKLAEGRRRDEAIRLASRQQLVTPVTGAVVLETKLQYQANGLQQVAPETVPMIPEPGTIPLFILFGGAYLWWRWRVRRRRAN